MALKLLFGFALLLILEPTCHGAHKKSISLAECGQTKGCYRTPMGCAGEQECDFILTWKAHQDYVDFEVSAGMLQAEDRWVAVGLSYDQMMGNDSVTDCIYNEQKHSFVIQSSYNNNTPNNEVLKNNELGLVPGTSEGTYVDHTIMCRFSRYINVKNNTESAKVFDLNFNYYILIAKGKAVLGVKQPHNTPPTVVPVLVNVTSDMYRDLNNIDLSGCGTTKGCFKSPQNCSGEQDCEHLLTWQVKDSMVSFEMSSLLTDDRKWTAVGFSYDQMMGNDSVVDCIYNETDQSIIIQSSYNTKDPNNVVLKNNQLGLVAGSSAGSYANGKISCTFSHYITAPGNDPEKDKVFNLNNTFYLFLARGPGMKGMKQKHTDSPAVSPKSVNVSDKSYSDVKHRSLKSTLVKAHGSLMIIAWMVFSSVALLIPRHYKDTGSSTDICGGTLWFQVHRLLMILCSLFTITAFIIIFVAIGGYANHLSGADAIHPIIGIMVTSGVILNPFMALMRPQVDSPNRPIFYAAHKTLGIFIFFIAAGAMFLGTRLDKAGMSDISQWIVVGFTIWHTAVDILLGLHKSSYQKSQLLVGGSESEIAEDTRALASSTGLPKITTVEAGRSVTVFKSVVILGHICVILMCAITLIVELIHHH